MSINFTDASVSPVSMPPKTEKSIDELNGILIQSLFEAVKNSLSNNRMPERDLSFANDEIFKQLEVLAPETARSFTCYSKGFLDFIMPDAYLDVSHELRCQCWRNGWFAAKEFLNTEKFEVNGYVVQFNHIFDEYIVSHDVIGSAVSGHDDFWMAIEDCYKG
ncbi:hypothetical protein [Shewanella sp. Iso12]|uniref:hypothetical protein n=1 Tax=Shewanella sp. Iso12 TaxID=1826753 RepID=UPI00143057A5|nr:hypothetical protein [Shewanella sp. Iso12]NJI86925.1 hypothetical protein [Shewanella sp. Iso12]